MPCACDSLRSSSLVAAGAIKLLVAALQAHDGIVNVRQSAIKALQFIAKSSGVCVCVCCSFPSTEGGARSAGAAVSLTESVLNTPCCGTRSMHVYVGLCVYVCVCGSLVGSAYHYARSENTTDANISMHAAIHASGELRVRAELERVLTQTPAHAGLQAALADIDLYFTRWRTRTQ